MTSTTLDLIYVDWFWIQTFILKCVFFMKNVSYLPSPSYVSIFNLFWKDIFALLNISFLYFKSVGSNTVNRGIQLIILLHFMFVRFNPHFIWLSNLRFRLQFTPGVILILLIIWQQVDNAKYRWKGGLQCFELVHVWPDPEVVKMYLTGWFS